MPQVRLVCDSTADLDLADAKAHDITVVPLRVIFGDEEFRDHYDIDAKAFYSRMRASETHPRTSQPSPAEFDEVFRRLAADGSTVVCTTLSSEMSGTFSSATQARAALPELDIRVFDSRTVTVGHNALVRRAIATRDAGGDGDAVVAALTELKAGQRVLFTVETLEALSRGGRIGGANKLLGNLLSIRPVLEVQDGKVETLHKVRTYNGAVDRLFEDIRTAADAWGGVEMTIGHGDVPDRVAGFVERARAINGRDPVVLEVGPVIGCHTGPGVVGVAYSPPNRDG